MGMIVALAFAAYFGKKIYSFKLPEVKLSYFLLHLSQNLISEVTIGNGNMLKFRGRDSQNWYTTNARLLTKKNLFQLLSEKEDITFSCEPKLDQERGGIQAQILLGLIGVCFSQLAYEVLYKKSYEPKSAGDQFKEKLRFEDIAGLDEAKSKLLEIINFLKEPERYRQVGARLRKGVLLYGPPGTGKTMLAKATAGESNSFFFYTTASEFVEMYVGVGAKRIRELFSQARKKSPCIIFIDEIDGLGSKRSSQFSEQSSSDSERATTLNQLLTEMDGFSDMQNIVVIAATNREQLLDKALIRSGRFDTKIKIGMPSENCRHEILQIHTKKKQHSISDEVLMDLAKKSEGFSGADIESVVNESAYICIQNNRQVIVEQDLRESFTKFQKDRQTFINNNNNTTSYM